MKWRSLVIGLIVLLISGCGSTSNSIGSVGGGTVGFDGEGVLMSGTITFDDVPITASGLDYDAIAAMPARGIKVEIHDLSGNVMSRGYTNASNYEQAPVDSNLRLVAIASVGRDDRLQVRDNTARDACMRPIKPSSVGSSIKVLTCTSPVAGRGRATARLRPQRPSIS